MPDSFSARLLARLATIGKTQSELARYAGVSAASVSDWARGVTGADNIKAMPLLRAAHFLGVDAGWLLTGAGAALGARLDMHEPPAPYSSPWPFNSIAREKLAALAPDDLLRLEGAWLLVARQLGFDVQAA